MGSFDPAFAEVESAKYSNLPDCWPTNAREWHRVKEQADRLNDFRMRLYKDQVSWSEILDWYPGDKNFLKKVLRTGISSVGVAEDIVSSFILRNPYKHSLLEIVQDMRKILKKDPDNELTPILSMAGLDVEAAFWAIDVCEAYMRVILQEVKSDRHKKIIAERNKWLITE